MPENLQQPSDFNNPITAALTYASRGWATFPSHGINRPCFGIKQPWCTCKDADCDRQGKHPRCAHGVNDATCDPAIIRTWRADSNIAIATGAVSGLFVVDFDPRHGGDETFNTLVREHGAFARDAQVFSGGKGLHIYYRYPSSGAPIGSGVGVFGSGVDLKGCGGYVIAPPSLHYSLKSYRWRGGIMPTALPTAPKWLLDMARAGAPARSSSAGANLTSIKTADHPVGQAIAKNLGARDRGTYWSFDCPVREHQTPDAAMYPHECGMVRFVCFSGDPCTHEEILAAVLGDI